MRTNAHGYQAGMKCACGGRILQIPASVNVTRTNVVTHVETQASVSVETLACVGDCRANYGRAI